MGLVEDLQYAWEHGDTGDKVVIGATGVGTASGAIPYVGDYISLIASGVIFVVDPSWSTAADVGLDVVGVRLSISTYQQWEPYVELTGSAMLLMHLWI